MKNLLIGLIIFLGLIIPGVQADQASDFRDSILKIYGNEPDPITGQPEAGRSCIEKDPSGKCIEWKVVGVYVPQTQKVINIAERVCIAPADGECEAVVVRGHDRAKCKASKGANCRARIILR